VRIRDLLIVLFLPLAACATYTPPAPVGAFLNGSLAPVEQHYAEQLQTGAPASSALFLNGLGTVKLLQGRLDEAWGHFQEAGAVMNDWATSGGETFAAIVGSESSKTWKGDPYEKAMNAYYLGLLYLFRGEPDDARAAFRSGLLADAETNDERFRADMALHSWLAGRMSLEMGLADDARAYFDQARSARTFARSHGARGRSQPRVLEDPDGGNVVFLVDTGLGPEKVPGGPQGELAVFVSRPTPDVRARIYAGDRLLGETEILLDVDYQARTRGGTEMEGIREGKAVLKTGSQISGAVLLNEGLRRGGDNGRNMAIVGGGLLLLSLFVSTEVDVRHWEILPSTVQVLTADLPPGEHGLRVEFLDAGGRVLNPLTQDWSISANDDTTSYYLFRALPGLDRQGTIEP